MLSVSHLLKDRWVWQWGSKRRHILSRCNRHLLASNKSLSHYQSVYIWRGQVSSWAMNKSWGAISSRCSHLELVPSQQQLKCTLQLLSCTCLQLVLYLIHCVLRAGVLNLHQHVSMQEIGGDHVRNKWRGLFLEDCSHDVISYVPFPLELNKQRGKGVGQLIVLQLRGHVCCLPNT